MGFVCTYYNPQSVHEPMQTHDAFRPAVPGVTLFFVSLLYEGRIDRGKGRCYEVRRLFNNLVSYLSEKPRRRVEFTRSVHAGF